MKDFSKIKISLSSPDNIRERSHGEVTKPETINYRTLVPEKDGLFCEAIFGPVKDWQCACGKYKRIRYKGIICEKCGVEVTKSKVRRERMGHIELAVPVSHIWYAKGIPNHMAVILGIAPKELEMVLYFARAIVIDKGNSEFDSHQIITEREWRTEEYRDGSTFKAGMGSEAILDCLNGIDLEAVQQELKAELDGSDSSQKKKKIVKRLNVIKNFLVSGNRPEWMILQALPVIPADLRPMVQLDGGRFATSDLNDLYRRVINRNKRLKKLKSMEAPEIILRNEKRMLQEAVDALIDNSRRDAPVVTQNNRELKSLSDMLKGKQGRFRQNLLGKRVDYSGRSVIVVGPNLKLHQCGLPKKMALELYKPFIMKELVRRGVAPNIKAAKRVVESEHDSVWEVAESVIRGHPVLLNRAPTLHKLSIQAFEPVLIEGKAIRLHPLVCSAFNADFDGDTMSVHLVLSPEAIMEAKTIMLSSNNLISAANGRPIVSPSREMLMGCYYMTKIKEEGAKGEGKMFADTNVVKIAYANKAIDVNALIKVRINEELVDTTAGRILFNELLPEDMRNYSKIYVDKDFRQLISNLHKHRGVTKTAEIVNNIKDFGFKYGTMAGITIGIEDLVIPSDKKQRLAAADKQVAVIKKKYHAGEIVERERYREIVDIWSDTVDELTQQIVKEVEEFNPVYMMSQSGARGGLTQMRQLSGMRGLVADTQGRIIEIPIKSNYREGLTVLEFFISSNGARKGSADKALRTADSGYLTRRLVDIAHDVIVTSDDCGTKEGIMVSDLVVEGKVIEKISDRLFGRVPAEDIKHGDDVLAVKNEIITREVADQIGNLGVQNLKMRSPLTCALTKGMCKKCYGMDLSNHKEVALGEAVGVIAAQSIGEPGTQLTMRTFHTGGVSEKQSTVTELLAPISGKVSLKEVKMVEKASDKSNVVVRPSRIYVGKQELMISSGSIVLVKDGAIVKEGDVLAALQPYTINIVADADGVVDLSGMNIKEKLDKKSNVVEHIVVKSDSSSEGVDYAILRSKKDGDIIAEYPLPNGAFIIHKDGSKIKAGESIAKILKEEKKSTKDITGGLPRVQQLFETRMPQIKAFITEKDGVIEIPDRTKKGMRVVIVRNPNNDEDFEEYLIPTADRMIAHHGDTVKKGARLTEGTIYVNDVLNVEGLVAAQAFILESIQKIYREQGVQINDKHIETIVRQMFRKVKVVDGGDSLLLEGDMLSVVKVMEENKKLAELGKKEVVFVPVAQGLTKASVNTDSFISAASFQETTKVLANAAIKGSSDTLEGLKENVIIGRKIPAGTGFNVYKEIEALMPTPEPIIRTEEVISLDEFDGKIAPEVKES